MPPVQLRVCPPTLCPPEAPAELWGYSWGWEGRGGPVGLQPLHPQAVLQGKPCFPSKGCNPGLTGLAGGQGPWLSLGWWLGATRAVRAAVPGQSSNSSQDRTCSHPVGAVTPLSPPSLCGAGLPQAWLWMGTVWGGSNPSLCSPRSCFIAGERLVQHHHHVQLVTRSVHLTP